MSRERQAANWRRRLITAVKASNASLRAGDITRSQDHRLDAIRAAALGYVTLHGRPS